MSEQIKRDSEAGVESTVGTGEVDSTTRALHEIQPNWVDDGHGIVGPRRQVVRSVPETPRRMNLSFDNNHKNSLPDDGNLTVTTEDVSGYTPGSGVSTLSNITTLTFDQDLFEIFDGGGGQCVVRLKTTDCSA